MKLHDRDNFIGDYFMKFLALLVLTSMSFSSFAQLNDSFKDDFKVFKTAYKRGKTISLRDLVGDNKFFCVDKESKPSTIFTFNILHSFALKKMIVSRFLWKHRC